MNKYKVYGIPKLNTQEPEFICNIKSSNANNAIYDFLMNNIYMNIYKPDSIFAIRQYKNKR